MIVGQSRIMDAPWPVKRVAVTDPAIADVDHARPWLEFYRAEDEVDLLVPVR